MYSDYYKSNIYIKYSMILCNNNHYITDTFEIEYDFNVKELNWLITEYVVLVSDLEL